MDAADLRRWKAGEWTVRLAGEFRSALGAACRAAPPADFEAFERLAADSLSDAVRALKREVAMEAAR